MIESFFQHLMPFTLLLGVLVFIHELGHYLVARFFGVKVEVFSLGFGPKIFKYKRGDTVYCLSLIPLGGYVKMFGDNPRQVIQGEARKQAFLCQKVGPKIAIALGGPIMNFLLAIVIFMIIGFIGREQTLPQLGDIESGSKAHVAGFRSGDTILSVGHRKVKYWKDVQEEINYAAEKKLQFSVQRNNKKYEIETQIEKKESEHITSLRGHHGHIEGLSIVSRSSHIGVTNAQSAAYKQGFRPFDEVREINGQSISSWRDLERHFYLFKKTIRWKKQKKLTLQVKRSSSASLISLNLLVHRRSSLKKMGIEDTSLYLDRVKNGSPADKAGLKAKDRLLSINDHPLSYWKDFSKHLANLKKDESAQVHFLREGQVKEASLTPEEMSVFQPNGQIQYRKMIGIASAQYFTLPQTQLSRISNPLKALFFGFKESLRWTAITVKVLYKLVTGSISRRMIGGPLSIAKAAKQSFSNSYTRFLQVMAIISINLFLMNLLPIPVLDGGHLMLFIIEGIKGSPLAIKKMEMLQMGGFALLFFFIILTIVNDIQNWNLIW